MSQGRHKAPADWLLPLSAAELELVGGAIPRTSKWLAAPEVEPDCRVWLIRVPSHVDATAVEFVLRGFDAAGAGLESAAQLLHALRDLEDSVESQPSPTTT